MADELSVCPAGIHGGVNAGRACSVVVGYLFCRSTFSAHCNILISNSELFHKSACLLLLLEQQEGGYLLNISVRSEILSSGSPKKTLCGAAKRRIFFLNTYFIPSPASGSRLFASSLSSRFI